MRNAVFIDAGAFIALFDRTDQYHAQATEASKAIESLSPKVTTPFVLMETCRYLEQRVNATTSLHFWRSIIFKEADVDLLSFEESDLTRAYRVREQYLDQSFSFSDCMSFVLLERHRIHRVFAFDQDFLIYKFTHGPITRIPETLE